VEVSCRAMGEFGRIEERTGCENNLSFSYRLGASGIKNFQPQFCCPPTSTRFMLDLALAGPVRTQCAFHLGVGGKLQYSLPRACTKQHDLVTMKVRDSFDQVTLRTCELRLTLCSRLIEPPARSLTSPPRPTPSNSPESLTKQAQPPSTR
jgi:hypothetical protein